MPREALPAEASLQVIRTCRSRIVHLLRQSHRVTGRKTPPMKIAVASDHAGYAYRQQIIALLTASGHSVVDFGTDSADSVDYPDFIFPAALAVARGECDRAIVLGGSGNGEAMAANRIQGVRCGLCWNVESALLCRQHNDANALSLGARMMSLETALEIVRVWLKEEFEGGRHQSRIEKLDLPPAEVGHVSATEISPEGEISAD